MLIICSAITESLCRANDVCPFGAVAGCYANEPWADVMDSRAILMGFRATLGKRHEFWGKRQSGNIGVRNYGRV
jgi:hypothetical protein